MIKMSIKSAKRLGYSIKGYVPYDKGLMPILQKSKKKKRVKKSKNTTPLIDERRICRLDLEKLN